MAKRATAEEQPAIEQPPLDTQDASAIRSFIEGMIASGAIAALVHWLIALLTSLWKTQNDLLDRLRSRKRRSGESEAFHRLQLTLPGLDWSAANDNRPPPKKRDPKKDKRKRGNNDNRDEHGRTTYPDHLERKPEYQRVPEGQRKCARCSIEMTLKEWLPREVLEKIPAIFFVRLILRERLQCPCCQQESAAAEPVETVRDNGSLGVDLVAEALNDHAGDAVPFERIERNARAMGVPLAANTLAASVYKMIDLLDPIVQHIFHRCVTSAVVGADATRMPVLDPKLPRGIYHASLWNLLGDERFSYFGYAPDGTAKELEKLLKGTTLSVLQCDGASTLNKAEAVSTRRAGCHSHARCYVVEALKSGDARAMPLLLLYTQLFAIEVASKLAKDDPSARLVRRIHSSRPLVLKLWAMVDELRPGVEPRSPLGRALTYLTRQRSRLELFLSDGRVAMTNNAVERELRTYVLDRKTWLFCGNEANAKRIAAALTIIRTCKLHGIDPRAYVRFVIRRILAGERDQSALWPENFAAQQAKLKAA
jgi:transposase